MLKKASATDGARCRPHPCLELLHELPALLLHLGTANSGRFSDIDAQKKPRRQRPASCVSRCGRRPTALTNDSAGSAASGSVR